jgi:hypothetical protein
MLALADEMPGFCLLIELVWVPRSDDHATASQARAFYARKERAITSLHLLRMILRFVFMLAPCTTPTQIRLTGGKFGWNGNSKDRSKPTPQKLPGSKFVYPVMFFTSLVRFRPSVIRRGQINRIKDLANAFPAGFQHMLLMIVRDSE